MSEGTYEALRDLADTINDVALREAVLRACGFHDGAELTAAGSADNDLAAERADVVLGVLALVRQASLPAKVMGWRAPFKTRVFTYVDQRDVTYRVYPDGSITRQLNGSYEVHAPGNLEYLEHQVVRGEMNETTEFPGQHLAVRP